MRLFATVVFTVVVGSFGIGVAQAKTICVVDTQTVRFLQFQVKPACKVSDGGVKVSSIHGAWFHNADCGGQFVSGVTGTCVSPGGGANLEINMISETSAPGCGITVFRMTGTTFETASGQSDLSPFDGNGDPITFVPADCKTRLPL